MWFRSQSWLLTGLVAAFAITGLAAVFLVKDAVQQNAPAGLSGTVTSTGTTLVGGPFALTDHTGQRVTDADFRGSHMLVYFGFTYCPDVCPTELQVMAAAIDQLGAEGERVQPLLISIDPERDTVTQLAEYVPHFHDRLIGLTGTPDELAGVAKAYRVYAKKVDDPESSASYTFDHSSIVYLMGPDGQFLTHFGYGTSPEKMASEIAKRL